MKLLVALATLWLAAMASSTASSPAASGGEGPPPPWAPDPRVHRLAPPGPIVAFGDSYTAGYGAPAGESYPDVLAASLGVAVLNRGVSGQTAAEALPRLQADVLEVRPRLAIVAFGANEALRGQPVATCIEALDRILAELRAHGIPVLLVGVHAVAFQAEFDAALRALAARHGTGLVLDVLAGTLEDGGLAAADGFHPNGAGYAVMESRIRPEAERLLGLAPAFAPADGGLGFVPEGGWGGRVDWEGRA